MLRAVAISGDRNAIKKEAEKIVKYNDLVKESQRTGNVKTKVSPVITGSTGTISKSLIRYLINLPGKQEFTGLQKSSSICHCTHTAESANVTYKTYFMAK
jgi:predicted transcriptional regulator